VSYVEISALNKTFGANHVVRGVDLNVERGEFVSLLGPSGCGKTTVLRMLAGFELPTSGRLMVDGIDITRTPTARRGVGMVFQAYALFPNMTVFDNVAFGLKVAGKTTEQIKARVAEMLDLIKLPQLALRFPYQLSGGQQQRVALARALAVSPRILLLDEPLSALDAKIRSSLRDEIRTVQRKLGITTIFVTHDQEEALSISDRVVVMNEGRIEQIGTPVEIYTRPASRFVASFVGTLTRFDAELTDAPRGRFSVAGQSIQSSQKFKGNNRNKFHLAIRPEAVALGRGEKYSNHLNVTIVDVKFMGSILRLICKLGEQEFIVDTLSNAGFTLPQSGGVQVVNFAPRDVFVLET
jgi:putative spermidine/putrescine transport system ATP-binding protein